MESNKFQTIILTFLCTSVFWICVGYGLSRRSSVQAEAEEPEKEEVSTMDKMSNAIMERERADLPLRLQEFGGLAEITIDSVVFTNDFEPYSGYMITTWTSKNHNKVKTMYVELENITMDDDRCSWRSNWFSTYMHF